MALETKTLAQLAKLAAGVNPSTQIQEAALAAPNGLPTTSGDGEDVSDATLAVVRIRADAGTPTFTVWQRTTNKVDEFEPMNALEAITMTTNLWSEVVFCGPLDEMYIEITAMGGATAIDLLIEPCLG